MSETTAGWSLEDITREGAQSETTTPSTGEAKVTVKPGDTATCTYSNERLRSLTIRKIVQPQSSGQKFAFTATGVTPDASRWATKSSRCSARCRPAPTCSQDRDVAG